MEINTITISLVTMIILISFMGVSMDYVNSAGNQLNDSGAPLGGLSAEGSLISLIIIASLLFYFFVFIKPDLK